MCVTARRRSPTSATVRNFAVASAAVRRADLEELEVGDRRRTRAGPVIVANWPVSPSSCSPGAKAIVPMTSPAYSIVQAISAVQATSRCAALPSNSTGTSGRADHH